MTDWEQGLQAFEEGRMREAADRLQAAMGENELTVSQTARYETCAYLGAALYALGLPTEALPAFERAFQLSPSPVPSDDLMMNLAHAYLAAGRREAAQEALRLLLFHFPGHVAAQMLALRLDDSPSESPVTGAVLGTSPETAHNYIRTLKFTRMAASGGYDPAHVQEALRQLERFINDLSNELQLAEEKIAQGELEILRYRQMEDAVVENMMQMQHLSQDQGGESKNALSPIEILFQQKS